MAEPATIAAAALQADGAEGTFDLNTQLAAAAGALAALVCFVLLMLLPLVVVGGVIGGVIGGVRGGPSEVGIPAGAVPFAGMYIDAGQVYGVSPFVLIAVHESETSYGSSDLPGVHDGVNSAGCCAGPMQFAIAGGASNLVGGTGGTWGEYAGAYRKARLPRPASYPNEYAPHPNVYDSLDSIYAAAAYLHALGAGPALDERTLQALIAYKGTPPASIPLARADYERALELEAEANGSPLPAGGLEVPGSRAFLRGDGLARAPADAPQAVKGMIAAANAISDRPYELVHYPTHIDNPTYDCSSATSHVLWGGHRFGVAPWDSTQLMSYGAPGEGRWVTVYASENPRHAFIVVAGLRFDTARYDTGPNADESGPRWREGPRPLENFVARHPEGL